MMKPLWNLGFENDISFMKYKSGSYNVHKHTKLLGNSLKTDKKENSDTSLICILG